MRRAKPTQNFFQLGLRSIALAWDMHFLLSPDMVKHFCVQKGIPLSGWFLVFLHKSKVLETVQSEVTEKTPPKHLEPPLNIMIKAFC